MPGAYTYGWDYDNNCWRKIRVNDQGKLIVDPSELFEEPPTDGETGKGATSNWCHDHEADADAHHAKYTDVEARGSIDDIFGADGKADKHIFLDNYGIFEIGSITMQKVAGIGPTFSVTYSAGTGVLSMWGKNMTGDEISLVLKISDEGIYRTLATEFVVDTKIADHAAIAAAHHAKYTDAEAVASFGNRGVTLTSGEYTNYNISNNNVLYLNTSGGDITLKGLAGGSAGQLVFCIKTIYGNKVDVIYNSGDAALGDRIITASSADESIAINRRGGFWMIYKDDYWRIGHELT